MPLHCNTCIETVSSALNKLDGIASGFCPVTPADKLCQGIKQISPDLETQTITVLGTGKVNQPPATDEMLIMLAPPSQIVKAIQDTGKDAILRGSGRENSVSTHTIIIPPLTHTTGAAVCILEIHAQKLEDPVRGLARMVQVADNSILIDVTIKGVTPGKSTLR